MIPPLKTVISDIGVIEIMGAKVEQERGFYWCRSTNESRCIGLLAEKTVFPAFFDGVVWYFLGDEVGELPTYADIVVIGDRLEPPE
jgi:hypothetical protein